MNPVLFEYSVPLLEQQGRNIYEKLDVGGNIDIGKFSSPIFLNIIYGKL